MWRSVLVLVALLLLIVWIGRPRVAWFPAFIFLNPDRRLHFDSTFSQSFSPAGSFTRSIIARPFRSERERWREVCQCLPRDVVRIKVQREREREGGAKRQDKPMVGYSWHHYLGLSDKNRTDSGVCTLWLMERVNECDRTGDQRLRRHLQQLPRSAFWDTSCRRDQGNWVIRVHFTLRGASLLYFPNKCNMALFSLVIGLADRRGPWEWQEEMDVPPCGGGFQGRTGH